MNQLDSQRLDDEIFGILKSQFTRIFSLFHVELMHSEAAEF